MIRRLLCALLFLLAAGAALAQEAGRFQIESITIEGGRREATRGIVIEESRLTTGREWTERELREAIYRIRRLPFIVRADFVLRRGSARGLYALAITVEETRPFFFSREADLVATSSERISTSLGYGYGRGTNLDSRATAGARLFVGARNVLFGSANNDEGFQAGYTRYGLFGRGGSATVSLAHSSFCCSHEVLPLALDPGAVVWSVESGDTAALSVLLPLSGNQSLRGAASVSRRDAASRRGLFDALFTAQPTFLAGERRESRRAELKWFYDTADDPLFPTQGVTVSGGVELAQQTVPVKRPDTSIFDRADFESDARLLALAATGRKSWPLSPRQSVSLGGRVTVGRSTIDHLQLADGSILREPVDLDSVETSVEARYSASLWGFAKTRDHGDLRAEAFVRAGYETTSPSFGGPITQISAGPSIAFRNAWGLFRVAFTYLDIQRSRR
jgi:hypothetical protein